MSLVNLFFRIVTITFWVFLGFIFSSFVFFMFVTLMTFWLSLPLLYSFFFNRVFRKKKNDYHVKLFVTTRGWQMCLFFLLFFWITDGMEQVVEMQTCRGKKKGRCRKKTIMLRGLNIQKHSLSHCNCWVEDCTGISCPQAWKHLNHE